MRCNLHVGPGVYHQVPLALVQHEFTVVFVAVPTLKGVLVAGDGELQVVGGLVHLAQSHVACSIRLSQSKILENIIPHRASSLV